MRLPANHEISDSCILAGLPRICILLCLAAQVAIGAPPSLTIYNQNFAVVRETVPLDLKRGPNQVRYAGATIYLEPSSVVLRDPSGKHQFQILEQNFRGDPVSQELLLALNEGRTITFEVLNQSGAVKEFVEGKLVRSTGANLQPIIEVGGKLRFGLPGQPIFPTLTDDTVLKPTLVWVIEAAEAATFEAELSYVTGEMRWEADYNLVLPEQGDALDIVGWITMDNRSGKSFEQAHVKLMAGDVTKIQNLSFARAMGGGGGGGGGGAPPVVEKTFDEYHLYTLEHSTTLHDSEKKQVEFLHAAEVKSVPLYIYDGVATDPDENRDWMPHEVLTQPEYGNTSNKKVWVLREFTNSVANHLGLPLPKGRVRVYRRNSDGQMEFTGENLIRHTPRDEVIRLATGSAFDLSADRKRVEFKMSLGRGAPGTVDPATGLPVPPAGPFIPPYIDEGFEIALRNHKKEPVEIRVVEHLARWTNWEIKEESERHIKADAQTIEFRVQLKPDEERKINYLVHYTWND